MYYCGTKDCQVVTDKYFCQIVVGKDKCPLVLQHVNESTSSTLLFNLFCFFFIRASVELADPATLYESMMFHWVFIINLYGSMNFCFLTYLFRTFCSSSAANLSVALRCPSPLCNFSFTFCGLGCLQAFPDLPFSFLIIRSVAHLIIHPMFSFHSPVFPFPSSFYSYLPISVPQQSRRKGNFIPRSGFYI